MENQNKYFIGFVLVFVFAVVVIVSSSYVKNTDLILSTNAPEVSNPKTSYASGDYQTIKMKVEGSEYILEPSEMRVGVPVRIEADISKVPGCAKSVVISAFGVRKTLRAGDNIIEFTPTKAGTFNIACSMNMFRGQFTVLDSDGTKAAYTEPAPTGGHTCGGSGGGCGGCGG